MPEPRELHPFSFTDPRNDQRSEGDFSIAYVPSDTPAHDGVVKPDPKDSSAQALVSSSKYHIPDVPLPAGFVPQSFIIPGDKMTPEPEQQELPFTPAPPQVTEPQLTEAEKFAQQIQQSAPPAITNVPIVKSTFPVPAVPAIKTEAEIADSDMSPAAGKGNTRPKGAKSGTLPS